MTKPRKPSKVSVRAVVGLDENGALLCLVAPVRIMQDGEWVKQTNVNAVITYTPTRPVAKRKNTK